MQTAKFSVEIAYPRLKKKELSRNWGCFTRVCYILSVIKIKVDITSRGCFYFTLGVVSIYIAFGYFCLLINNDLHSTE